MAFVFIIEISLFRSADTKIDTPRLPVSISMMAKVPQKNPIELSAPEQTPVLELPIQKFLFLEGHFHIPLNPVMYVVLQSLQGQLVIRHMDFIPEFSVQQSPDHAIRHQSGLFLCSLIHQVPIEIFYPFDSVLDFGPENSVQDVDQNFCFVFQKWAVDDDQDFEFPKCSPLKSIDHSM